MLEERIEAAEGWQAMDAWCSQRIEQLGKLTDAHIMRGGKLDHPRYRAWFGEHRAYSAMRSFIHGARKADNG